MKKIILTVTNDLCYDQRMMRICKSLAGAGFSVLLVGRKRSKSPPLSAQSFGQRRLNGLFSRGKLFYLEYNLRLFFFLLTQKADCLCAIDLDTIIPVYWVSRLRGTRRVYDAHELFTEMDEILSRPAIYKAWRFVERSLVPRFEKGYTVCDSLAQEFHRRYGVSYGVIRNVPVPMICEESQSAERFVLYQGAVNKGRGLEKLAAAMRNVPARLYICGEGNFFETLKEYVEREGLTGRVHFTGYLAPPALKRMTCQAYVAINPFESKGLNQYLSLANKFFDYIQAGVPQVTMNYPEYRKINEKWGVALLIDDLEPATLATAINKLLENDVLHKEITEHCHQAGLALNWDQEELKLVQFYKKELFGLD